MFDEPGKIRVPLVRCKNIGCVLAKSDYLKLQPVGNAAFKARRRQ
jgi:hypothetical protein